MTGNVEALKLQHAQFSKFVSALYPNLQSMKTQILAGDGSIPSLSIVHSTLLSVAMDHLHQTSIKNDSL